MKVKCLFNLDNFKDIYRKGGTDQKVINTCVIQQDSNSITLLSADMKFILVPCFYKGIWSDVDASPIYRLLGSYTFNSISMVLKNVL